MLLHDSIISNNINCRPKNKYIRIYKDENFVADKHYLSKTPSIAEEACSYDLDQCDAAWLQLMNGERARLGLLPISDEQFERVIEDLEVCLSNNDAIGHRCKVNTIIY